MWGTKGGEEGVVVELINIVLVSRQKTTSISVLDVVQDVLQQFSSVFDMSKGFNI